GLQSSELRENALKIRDILLREDGVGGAVDCFYRHLPLKNMRCDLGCKRIAVKWSQKDRMKLCETCEFIITSRAENSSDDIVEYDAVDYTARGPDSALGGVASGAGAFMHELGSGVKDIFIKPTQGYRDEGAKGAVIGLMKGIGGIFIRPVQGAALFADHVATGHYNESRASDERKKGTVLLENKKFLSALGMQTAPQTHTAAMNAHEQLDIDRKANDRQQIAIHLPLNEKAAMEAKFNEIMQKRRLSSSSDDFVVVKGTTSKKNVSGPAPTAHLVVSSAEYNEQGGIDIRYRNNSEANKSLSEAEMRRLEQAAREQQDAQHDLFGSLQSKKVPHMNICMMTTGSWDESVQQYVAIGLRLKADGHRVRIATNSGFRDRIIAAGLEFYPLGGRATTIGKFLGFMYEKSQQKKSKGFFGLGSKIRTKDAFPEVEDLKELMFSLWPACVDVDPLAPGRLFRADAIISHPFMFGQATVAERLGVPLHCMSYNPLSRTQAFPHLMSTYLELAKPYRYAPTNSVSYDIISNLMWDGMRDLLDSFRSSLGLTGKSVGTNLLAEWRVPHSYLWNPELLPKPMDWGSEINVAGYVQLEEPEETDDRVVAISLNLDYFVASNPSTAFVYFGFAKADWEPRHVKDLLHNIEVAAQQANVRVIFQTFEESDDSQLYASDTVLEVSPQYPLKNILKHVHAALHWGDLSITSSVLAAGKPACVIARNVTQRLWGQALVNAGVGLRHLETDMLSVENLAQVFQGLLQPQIVQNAAHFANSFSTSAAVHNAVSAFYANLPLTAMTCDLDPTRIARIYDSANQLKLSYEAHIVVRGLMPSGDDGLSDIKYKPIKYSLHHGPRLSLRGLKDDRGLGDDVSGPAYTYDVSETAPSSGLGNSVKKVRAKLNRYQSVAVNVIETPAFWASEAEEERETKRINGEYERLLLARELPLGHH
ncbi:Sterol 3-beta-glucosyltransferase, partial [Globisporangium polare]